MNINKLERCDDSNQMKGEKTHFKSILVHVRLHEGAYYKDQFQ